jgi:hypothetical protein
MVVQILHNGRAVTGLHIGLKNVQRYFPRGRQIIDLELGRHLLIRCKLQPAFWRDQPNISDPRLNLWLAVRETESEMRHEHTRMSLVPVEGESFRLEFTSAQPA